MNMKNVILFLFINLMSVFVFAQGGGSAVNNNITIPKLNTSIIPASPDAASLGKYGSFPVNKYMGKINMDIDIHQLNTPTLNLPIKLTYNYNGYMPGAMASSVGLGWDLQAGGVITRSVRGRIDELATNKWADLPSPMIYKENQLILKEMSDNNSYGQSDWDLEPDLFHFNFSGYSGSFIMVKNKAIIFPHQDLKITCSNNYTSFEIVTPNGVTYKFQDKEFTSVAPNSGSFILPIPSHPTSWYLTKMQSINNEDEINFTYENWTFTETNRTISETYIRKFGYVNGLYNNPNQNNSDVHLTSKIPLSTILAKRLKTISSRVGQISFAYEANSRIDLGIVGAKALHKILISKNSGVAIVKTVELIHEYFGDFEAINSTQLKLKGLKFFGADNINTDKAQSYNFEYLEENAPDYLSKTRAIDIYGYYNGVVNNTSLFTKDLLNMNFDPKDGNANRSINFNKLKYGALSKVTYPTKGYSTFEYENNIVELNNVSPYVYITQYATCMAFTPSPNNPPNSICETQFYLDLVNGSNQTFSLTVTRNLLNPPAPGDPIHVVNSTSLLEIFEINNPDNPLYTLPLFNNNEITKVISAIALPPAQYKVKLKSESNIASAYMQIIYKKEEYVPIPNQIGPGLRIKEIKNYDNLNNTSPTNAKRFVYSFPAKNNLNNKGGKRLNVVEHMDDMPGGGGTCEHKAQYMEHVWTSESGDNHAPYTTAQYYYPEVVEEDFNTVETNGKIVSKYSNPAFSVAGVQEIEQTVYDKANNIFK
jgi:hypothetical protein